jgi:hypothetical protein
MVSRMIAERRVFLSALFGPIALGFFLSGLLPR